MAATTTYSCIYPQTAKNPFSQLGYKKHIYYTSSKGEFEEFHGNYDVVEIGSVYFNTKSKNVVGYVNEEKENAEVAGATSAMTVDPLCEKYYWITPYAYCLNNPVKYIDPDGREVKAVFNRETHKLYIMDLDNYKKGLPILHLSANNYKLGGMRDNNGNLTHNQILVVNNVFSGGVVENGNIVRDRTSSEQRAIPTATFDIVDNNADTRHTGWFRLDRQDGSPLNDVDDVTNRDGYRFHLGVLSWGCVTVDKTQDNAQESWSVVSSILNSTSTTTVKENRGNQWLLPWSNLKKYGIMIVKGADIIPYKPEEE